MELREYTTDAERGMDGLDVLIVIGKDRELKVVMI